MREKITDEKFDEFMRTLVADASVEDDGLKTIADSPNLWWAVQRDVRVAKANEKLPWPPANVIRRWLAIGIPLTAAGALVISLLMFRPSPTEQRAALPLAEPSVVSGQVNAADPASSTDVRVRPPVATREQISYPKHVAALPVTRTRKAVKRRVDPAGLAANSKSEIKTDFIALSYARQAESGQVVRVKVPSSMMVTLGVVASVEKPANLVDAEVLVGDDGLTRAIRFIRTN